jgi:hypothetical protein
MKKIKIVLIALLGLIALSSQAQVFNAKPSTAAQIGTPGGPFGTIQQWATINGAICAVITNTVTPVATGKLDTLTNVDTGYVQWTVNNRWDMLFDFYVTKISGTVAGTSLLQGSIDNATWNTLTGNTTALAGGQGASCTVTNTTGTKHYQWFLPAGSVIYPYYQIQTITSGTMTASYGGTVGYKK